MLHSSQHACTLDGLLAHGVASRKMACAVIKNANSAVGIDVNELDCYWIPGEGTASNAQRIAARLTFCADGVEVWVHGVSLLASLTHCRHVYMPVDLLACTYLRTRGVCL
jgi:hypothetical protein